MTSLALFFLQLLKQLELWVVIFVGVEGFQGGWLSEDRATEFLNLTSVLHEIRLEGGDEVSDQRFLLLHFLLVFFFQSWINRDWFLSLTY